MISFGIIVGLVGLGALNFVENREYSAVLEQGASLYSEHCAACHGVNLEGEPDWQSPKSDGTLPAPPHDETGHTWHHDDGLLFDYVKLGGAVALAKTGVDNFNSGMPAFEDLLNDDEISVILEYIKSNWSEEIRAIQKERSQ